MKRRKYLNNQGFSLMEILIVITLIAVAGTFVVGNLIDSLNDGRQQTAKTQIKQYGSILEDYRRRCNTYPTTEQGLEALIENPENSCKRYPPNGFLQDGKLIDDPWGNPYEYESDGRQYTLRSYGADSQPGGENYDKDISNRD